MENLYLAIPDKIHEKAYTEMMDRWEAIEHKINPQLLSRYSEKLKGNVLFSVFGVVRGRQNHRQLIIHSYTLHPLLPYERYR